MTIARKCEAFFSNLVTIRRQRLSHPKSRSTILFPFSRVEMWRGGLGAAYLFPPLSSNGASIASPCSVSTSRSSVGSRAGAPSVGSGGHSTAFAMGLSPAPVVTFPTPATSNPACRLPAPGFPADFLSRVMGPMVPEWLSARGRQPDTQKTVRVLCITTAYSTASSQNPDLCARASDGA